MDYRSIIESKYNRSNWQGLLYDIFRQKVQFWQQPQLVPVDESMAKRALYTGKITLPDGHIIAIYEVELSDSVIIERNRAGIRNLLCTNWRGMGCSGAFMFCFRQDEAVLRFSYVSESFVFTEDGSITKESTDTKRFTYLLGEGHRSRTAIKQFEDLKKSSLDLKAITKAFSVEALSDLFFKEYKKHYEDIIEFITGKRMVKVANKWEEQMTRQPCREIMQEFAQFPDAEKAVRDYVKKLMGRLVFIQFLQKKGWMGCSAGEYWSDGDKEFVQNLFVKTPHKNTFVDDVLEPLFNDINTKRLGDIASSPNVGVGIKIPYLNGGLFEKDDYDKTRFPLPAEFMKKLLDFFASYNFTIDENDPDDAEIGVDPEMLGRIFENLLEDNKDKGAFYTPKEIVQYMCRESLIAYLQTDVKDDAIKQSIRQFVSTYDETVLSEKLKETVDQKLKDVKICDPAIGSGAFPMGLLKELYACRKAIEGIDDDTAVSIKTHIIQNNIYGVDIEKGAVDIARLRFWLALIVDEKDPHALPNMDFKIMQGNSLLEQYEGVELSGMSIDEQKKRKTKKGQLWQATLAFDEKYALDNIQRAIKEYYLTDNYNAKLSLRSIINENVRNYIINLKGCTPEVQSKIEKLPIPNDKFFLWHIYFKEVFDKGGFDIVIGNPPYIKEGRMSKTFFEPYKDSPYYKGKMDIWYLFACNGLDLLNPNGILCFIATNNWVTSFGASKLRDKVIKETRICNIVDFGAVMMFESASIQTMIMMFQKDKVTDDYTFDYRKLTANKATEKEAIAILTTSYRSYEQAECYAPTIRRANLYGKNITFSQSSDILGKISSFSNVIYLNNKEIAQGIVFPQDTLNKKNQQKLGTQFNINQGIFVLTSAELDTLTLNQGEQSLIKPYYTNENISRYGVQKGNRYWTIYTDSRFKNPNSLDCYPNIKQHLDRFVSVFTSDNKPYGLHRAREGSFFVNNKVIAVRKCVGHPIFSYCDFECYLSQTFNMIQTDRVNLKYLTGLLNSKLIEFWLKNKGKMQGANYQLDKEPLQQIPIAVPSAKMQDAIVRVVDEILDIKKENLLAETIEYEKQIDLIVYHLYNLTFDEVLIIDSETSITREEYDNYIVNSEEQF